MNLYEVIVIIAVMLGVCLMVVYYSYKQTGAVQVSHLLTAQSSLIFLYSVCLLAFRWESASPLLRILAAYGGFVAAIGISVVNVLFVAAFCGEKSFNVLNLLIIIGGIGGLLLLASGKIIVSISGLRIYYGWGQYFVFVHSSFNVVVAVIYLTKALNGEKAFQFSSMRTLQVLSFCWTLVLNGVLPRIIGDSRYSFLSASLLTSKLFVELVYNPSFLLTLGRFILT